MVPASPETSGPTPPTTSRFAPTEFLTGSSVSHIRGGMGTSIPIGPPGRSYRNAPTIAFPLVNTVDPTSGAPMRPTAYLDLPHGSAAPPRTHRPPVKVSTAPHPALWTLARALLARG